MGIGGSGRPMPFSFAFDKKIPTNLLYLFLRILKTT